MRFYPRALPSGATLPSGGSALTGGSALPVINGSLPVRHRGDVPGFGDKDTLPPMALTAERQAQPT